MNLRIWAGAFLMIAMGALPAAAQSTGTPQGLKQEAIAKLGAAKTGEPGFDAALDQVIASIRSSLGQNGRSLFVDPFHLVDPPEGKKVFEEEERAAVIKNG